MDANDELVYTLDQQITEECNELAQLRAELAAVTRERDELAAQLDEISGTRVDQYIANVDAERDTALAQLAALREVVKDCVDALEMNVRPPQSTRKLPPRIYRLLLAVALCAFLLGIAAGVVLR